MNRMKWLLTMTLTAGWMISTLQAQHFHWGPEIQAYPTGLIPGIAFEKSGDRGAWNVRLGYNLVNHRDLGIQDDERGGGFGGSLGYQYFLKKYGSKWFMGARTDLWRNRIDWKNQPGTPQEVQGTSKIVVLQPTAIAGYAWGIGSFQLRPTIAFGAEINVKTVGKEVGHGAILLAGIQLVW